MKKKKQKNGRSVLDRIYNTETFIMYTMNI